MLPSLSPLCLAPKKELCNLVFLSLQKTRKQIDEVICKVVNVMEMVYFYENFFRFTKKFLLLLTLQRFFLNIFTPASAVVKIFKCFQLIFIIEYAVRKNIFARLFSVHNTTSLHVVNKYV